ncbi:MAG: hypothetical protein F6K00_19290 [Leptolyngbya sp. SIOISBB]|nr:hypothetical protein [Leptolyngbya sp. SIOISBB]
MIRKLGWMILLIPLVMSGHDDANALPEASNECRDPEEYSLHRQLSHLDREELLRNPEEYLRDPDTYLRSRGVDIEAWLQESEAHFTRPWSERRGIEHFDRNDTVTLVRVPLDQLSDFLATRAVETQRDVLGNEIELSGLFGFAYQLTGHDWSMMIWDHTVLPNLAAEILIPKEAQLSESLQQPVVTLTFSNDSVAYRLFERGQMTEYFWETWDETVECPDFPNVPAQRYDLSLHSAFTSEAGNLTICFGSTHHPLPLEATESLRSLPNRLICESGAYDPGIGLNYLLGTNRLVRGNRHTVQNPGFSITLVFSDQEITTVPDLARVDYFKFAD